jgi:hypothetical protein
LKETKSTAHAAGYKKGFADAQRKKKAEKSIPGKKITTKGTRGKTIKATAKSKANSTKKRGRPKKS